MRIVLMCPGASSGQSAFPAELIEGIPAPERRYNIQDGTITLSGFSDVILHHDADVLLSMSMFRLPTPAEQEAMTQAEQQSGRIQENTELSGNEQMDTGEQEPPDVPPAVDNTPVDNTDADSSPQSKKKASGG